MILGTVLAVIIGLTGFYAVFLQDSGPVEPETGFEPVTADHENSVATASFYNESIDLMYEDRQEARMYLDYDRDGSFDYELDVQSDGERHNVTRTVNLDGDTYELSFRYVDYSNRTGDGEITLYQVNRQ